VLIPNSTLIGVFRALTSSKIHSEVTGSSAKVNARIGRKFTAWDGYITGKNLKLVQGKKNSSGAKNHDWQNQSVRPSLLESDERVFQKT
jgi:hypothetical protein